MNDAPSHLIPHTEYLSVLSFENRSKEDQAAAVERVNDNSVQRVSMGSTPLQNFERDVSLIVHSPAFLRLGKLTMIAPSKSPAFQNRLSHSLTVAETGTEIAEALHLGSASKALINAIALAHDIGHPPFSHEGEEAINNRLEQFGIHWNHDQAVMDILQNFSLHGLDYDGIPLTAASLEGISKRHRQQPNHLGRKEWSHVEGQIAAVADWIAGTVTDIQDVMTMKMTSQHPVEATRQFLDALSGQFPLARKIVGEINENFADAVRNAPHQERSQWKSDFHHRTPPMVQHFCDRLKDALVADVVAQADELLSKYRDKIKHAEDVRTLPELIVTPSPQLKEQLEELKIFYRDTIYEEISQKHLNTVELVGMVFDDFAQGKVNMPDSWNRQYEHIQSQPLPEMEKQREITLLVAQYLTSNMSNDDVIKHLKKHHASEAHALLAQSCEAPHPINPYPQQGR